MAKPAAKADPLKLGGISRLDEKALRAAGDKAKKAMWKANLGSPERVKLEKRATAYYKAANQAHAVKSSKLGSKDPAKLWNTPNKARLVDFLGAVVNVAMGVPSDAINAISAGAKVGAPMLEAEYRKSILGGLLALKTSGAATVDIKGLSAPIIGNDKINAALAKAAGTPGKDLEQTYNAIVKRIASYGPGMCAAAWSYRQQLWLKDVAGIEAVHATTGAVVALFVPLGSAIGAAIGGHSAITLAVSQMLGLKADVAIKRALPKAKAEAAAKASPGASGGVGVGASRPGTALATLSGLPLFAKIGIGVGIVGGLALVARQIRSA
ncbi:MAG: hypothetical protein Q8P18_33220 [Pseudomonadota bacterium]|nr:hypothetical protein [Pseudomonadota bacterium]